MAICAVPPEPAKFFSTRGTNIINGGTMMQIEIGLAGGGGTPDPGSRRRLIIAPHADDESLGCGGLIATAPESVTVVVLADKDDGRMEEFEQARKVLGYTRAMPPKYRTGTLADNMRDLVGHLDGIIRSQRPHSLLLPAPGTHQDHIAAYEAGMRASRLSYTDGSWFVPEVVLYDVPGYANDLYATPYRWNRFLPLGSRAMADKADAIRAYESQLAGHHDPVELAYSQAKMLGGLIGRQFAEQYAVVREIEEAQWTR